MTTCYKEVKLKVIQDLNKKYGKDLIHFEKCAEIIKSLQEQKGLIEEELDITNNGFLIGKTIKHAETIHKDADLLVVHTKEVIHNIEKSLDEIDDVRTEVKEHFSKLNSAECVHQYMRVIQQIEYLSMELEREVVKNDDEKCVTLFANLTEMGRNLIDSPAMNLRNYLKDIIYYWHEILRDKLSKDFDDVLKLVKWPFVSSNINLVEPLQFQVEKIQVIAEYLLQIEIPEENIKPVLRSALLSDFPPLSLPIHFLVQPLRKRFIYHFYGSRQTNRLDKPEWYFTQILTWIRDHRQFVGKWIQPVINKLGLHHIDAELEFARGLVQLAVEKLCSDLPSLQYDDFSFSHSIDEALGFDKELRETYDYPPTQPSILAVLTQAHVFVKWLAMEKKYAIEKMDIILSPASEDTFELITSDVDDLKITTCADAFITLLQTITERYESLPQPGHRIQFLELQLDLLDDFRVRLLQLVNAEEGNAIESKLPRITNTIYYIENVLVDWGAMLHFLNLYYYKNQLNLESQSQSSTLSEFDDETLAFETMETDTVFAETLSLYRHMRKDLLCGLAETVILELRNKSKNYRREKWSHMKLEKESRSLSLTPSACPLFEILGKRLHQLQKNLQGRLFTIVWRAVATQLDNFLFEDLVMDNRFNEGGAAQLKFDIMRNLLPLFAQFSENPGNYFTQIIEACNLLSISKGSALLLRENLIALEGATGVEDTRGKFLQEIGVLHFTPKMAVKILNQRTDITVNRLTVD